MRGVTLIEMMLVMIIMIILLKISWSAISISKQEAHDEMTAEKMMDPIYYASEMSFVTHATIELCIEKDGKCVQKGMSNMMVFIRDVHANDKITILKKISLDNVMLGLRSYSGSKNATRFYSDGDLLSDNSFYYGCHRNTQNPSFAISIDRMANVKIIKPNKQGDIIDSHAKKMMCETEF